LSQLKTRQVQELTELRSVLDGQRRSSLDEVTQEYEQQLSVLRHENQGRIEELVKRHGKELAERLKLVETRRRDAEERDKLQRVDQLGRIKSDCSRELLQLESLAALGQWKYMEVVVS
jgi:uncharacterized membrane protein YccC